MKPTLPIKTVSVLIRSQEGIETWPYSDTDEFWVGGSNPRDYRWRLELNIRPQKHSSHLSVIPYEFNGLDINVGDWVANCVTSLTLQIISIESKTRETMIVIAEDIHRYNTFRAPGATGSGAIGVGEGIVFKLDSEGEAMIESSSASMFSATFMPNIEARFQSFNDENNFQLYKKDHTFVVGDIIAADSVNNTFVKATESTVNVVGTVVLLGPGPHRFYVSPKARVLDDFDYLPGEPGKIMYLTSLGALTTTTTNKEVYIKLRNNTQTTVRSLTHSVSATPGSQFSINGTNVLIAGSGSINDAVSAINTVYATTGVQAFADPVPSVMAAPNTLFYGEVAVYASIPYATATIDGVIVTFDIKTRGQAVYGQDIALPADIAEAINRDMEDALNTNIVAEVVNGSLIVKSLDGTLFVISNGVNDINGTPFAGVNSCTGLSLVSVATSTFHLLLEADDAREIILRNVFGTPLEDYQIASSENGIKAAAMVIEKTTLITGGGSGSGAIVVPNIAARDALVPGVGAIVFVEDNGNSEWAMYVYDGTWVSMSNQDSARADADSFQISITNVSGSPNLIGTLSDNSRVNLITVEVTVPFDGTPVLTIGDAGNNSRLLTSALVDLTEAGIYSTQSEHLYSGGGDTNVFAYFSAGGATTGQAVITISYM